MTTGLPPERRYYVHCHDDHYHVVKENESGVLILDDRVENPWLFIEKGIADNVVTLLNAGADPQIVKAMVETFAAGIAVAAIPKSQIEESLNQLLRTHLEEGPA